MQPVVPLWLYYLALAGFGLLFGSFANVVIWRFPRGESLAAPASHCPKCGRPIAWFDNIPVASWVILQGRCRSCSVRISARYPAVEVLSGLLWLAAGLAFGMAWRTVFAVVFFYALLVLTFIDIDHQRLPNPIVGVLGLVGFSGVAASMLGRSLIVPLTSDAASSPVVGATLGVLLGGGPALLISLLYSTVRSKPGLGMGDVKLLSVMGLFLGPYVLLALMIGSVFGSVVGLASARRGEGLSGRRIPFGPYLAAGAVISAVWGPGIWDAYARLVGL